MRLVLDTNTVVSGFLWESAPRKLLDAAIERWVALFTSPQLISELTGVLYRAKFAARLAHQQLTPSSLVERYQILADVVEPAVIMSKIARDPSDDAVLAAALAAKADAIVSGDKRVRNLKHFQRIPIVSAAEALTLIAPAT